METQRIDENALIQQAQGTDQQSLYNLLVQLDDAYHNGIALASDATYDALRKTYTNRFGPYTRVGAVPRGEKEDLDTYRGHLDTIMTEEELNKYLQEFPGDHIIMTKVDGLNLQYILTISPSGYREEKLLTRGNGLIGRNVTHVLPYLNIPKLNFDIDVIGECYVPIEAFERTKGMRSAGKTDYRNPRNMASSMLNSKESFNPVIAQELRFAAFKIVNNTETPETQVLILKQLGFEVPDPIKVPAGFLTMELLNKIYAQRKAEKRYPMDGLVIYQNKYVEEYPGETPKHIRAFKIEEESHETVVTHVTWKAKKRGYLKPRIWFQPVNWKDGEATLTKTNGDNARNIISRGIGPGARVLVTRSKDVIPRITEVLQPVQPSYPDPNVHGQYAWDPNGVELVLLQENNEMRAAKLESFFKKLKIEHLKEARAKALVDAGLTTIQAVLLATPQQLSAILGPTLGPDAYNEIHTKIKGVSLPRLMAASGIFPNIGETLFKDIYNAYPMMGLWFKCDPNIVAQAFLQVKGFKERAYVVANKMSEFGDFLAANPMITVEVPISLNCSSPTASTGGTLLTINTNVPQIPQNLKGKTIIFTGQRDRDLEAEIEKRGGKIGSAVSKNTSFLVMEPGTPMRGKAEKAQSLGVPIMMMNDFKRQFIT
jgi:DNA ligase (NAD+)